VQEKEILHQIAGISSAIAAGTPRETVFQRIAGAVQELGFARVHLYLVTEDGATLTPVASAGSDEGLLEGPVPAAGDPDLIAFQASPELHISSNPRPRGCFPVILQGRVIGKLTVEHEPSGNGRGRFDALQAFSHLAALAQAVPWVGSLEALQQTTRAILSVRDRTALLTTIVEQSVKLLGAKSGGLYEFRPEQDVLTVIADYNRPHHLGKTLKRGQGLAGKLIGSGKTFRKEKDYHESADKAEIYDGNHEFGAVLEVLLSWEQKELGVLYVDDLVGREFSDLDVRLLQLFADQAAICLAHAALFEKDQLKLRRFGRLAQVTQEMMGNLDAMSWRKRLETIARSAAEVLEAETSGVFRVRGDELVLEASVGQEGEFTPGAKRTRIHNQDKGGLTGWIAYQGRLFNEHGARLKLHPAVSDSSEPHAPSGSCYSLLALPLKQRGNGQEKDLIGLLRADNKKGADGKPHSELRFTQEDEEILTIFADAAVIAFESAELVDRLKEQRDFQERLISSSPDGIISVDRQGKVTEFNTQAQDTLGYSKDEVLGRWVGELYFTPEVPHWIGQRLREAEDHHVRGYETVVRAHSGEEIPILHSSTWLYDSQGERVGSVGYFADLRQQKARERRESLLLESTGLLTKASDLNQGLQSLVQMIVAKLGCSFCGILLRDEDEDANTLRLRAQSLAGKTDGENRNRSIVPKEWKGLQARLDQGLPYQIARHEPQFEPVLDRLARVLGFDEPIISLLVVPLKLGDVVVGQLDLGELKETGRPAFQEEEVQLVSAIAAQVTALIHRFELLETTDRRQKLLTTLVEASRHIRAEIEMPALLQSIVRLAAELVDCQVGALYLNRRNLGQLDRAAAYGAPEDQVTEYLRHEESFLGKVAMGEPLIHPKPMTEDLFLRLHLEAVAAVPLTNVGDVEAVLFVGDTTRQPFSRTDLDILKLFATQAATALRTARLLGQEQRYLSQIAVLQRIGRYVLETDQLDHILHAVLTGVTADYGLGFNRAMLLLVDDRQQQLVGELGIGEVEEGRARAAWRSDVERRMNDFERYLERLEGSGFVPSTVGQKLSGFVLPLGGSDLLAEILADRKFRRIEPAELERVHPRFRETFRVTTHLAVAPLVSKGRAIGLLVADNKFTQMPVGSTLAETLMAFAATAAVAIVSKRLFEQTRSNATKLSTLYQMTSELMTLREPQEILNRTVEQTEAVTGAAWVSIIMIDRASRTLDPVTNGSRFPSPGGLLQIRPEGVSMAVMETGKARFFEDVGNELGAEIPPNPSLLQKGVKSAICLPLSTPGKRIGVLWIHYHKAQRFPDSEVAALQLYVNQTAAAYDSARRLEKLEKLRAVLEDLAEAEDTQGILRQIVEGAQYVSKADDVVFWVFEKTTNSFSPEDSVYAGNHPEAWAELQKKGPRPGGTATTIMSQDWLYMDDFQDPEQSQKIGPTTQEFLVAIGGRGFHGVALKVGKEKLGVLYAIYSEPCRFEDEERDTAQAFAGHAALALKKAKLFQQVQRAREAADLVARVTLLEDHGKALVSIAGEIRAALDCHLLVLFKYDADTGELILPTAVAGELLPTEEEVDRPLVFAMLNLDGPHVVPDTHRDKFFKASSFTHSQEIKACVAFPLKAAGRKVGILFACYRHRHRFTAEEVATMELLANQTAVAVHNAHLYGELSAKLTQQGVLAGLSKELLGVSSVRETLDRAVKYAAAFFETEFCNVVLPDREGRLMFRAAFGWDQSLIDVMVLDPGPGSQTGYTIQEKRPIPVPDYDKVTEFTMLEMVRDKGIRSGLSAPMFRKSEVVGSMLVHTTQPRHFTKEDELLICLIADQTALGLERAQHYEKSQRQSDYLRALNEANKLITASFGMEQRQLLERIIQPTMQEMVGIEGPSAILGTVFLYDEARRELIVDSVYPPERREGVVSRLGERWSLDGDGKRGIAGRAVDLGRPQLVANVKDDPDYREAASETQSELAVPLLERDKILGVLNTESDRINAFDEEDIEALETLAELAVIAIQNARQLEELRTQIDLALMGLRNTISDHELGGRIGSLRALIYLHKKTLGSLFHEIDDALASLSIERPPGQADQEVTAIWVNKDVVQPYQKRFGERRPTNKVILNVACDADSSDCIRVNAEWLFRVIDIMVNNAIQAMAQEIVLGSQPTPGRKASIDIYVADDGQGIPSTVEERLLHEPIREGSNGLGRGLLIAKLIVRTYGGSIAWKRQEPRGTIVTLTLPLAPGPEMRPSA
jgi:PAS domain S-box-containing protein